jgi:hypothetical protein
MNIEEAKEIDDLISFTDQEILRSAKYRCVKDGANPDYLIYKIKIGKMIFTMKISPEDSQLPSDDSTKRKLAEGSMQFLIARLRRRTGLYPNELSN